MTNNTRRSRKGFTLVELIVVIAILGVLAAIIVPTTLHFVNQANDEAAADELSVIMNAVDAGLNDYIGDSSEAIDADAIAEILTKANLTATENGITIALSASDGNLLLQVRTDYSGDIEKTLTKTYSGLGHRLASGTGDAAFGTVSSSYTLTKITIQGTALSEAAGA